MNITQKAADKINEIIAEEQDPTLKVRCFVQGGGCSGFQYNFALETEQGEDDFVFEQNGATVLVDSMSMQYLQGATIDYKDGLESSFVISNPNAQTTCGCGSSFSV